MKKSIVKATALRNFMIIILLGLIAGSIGGFYHYQDQFRQRAATLKLNSVDLAETDTTNKLTSILISSQNYESLIKRDLDTYTAKISPNLVKSYTTSQNGAVNTDLQAIGIKTESTTINFNNPVKFSDLMKFIKAIETNLPKMSIENLNIKKGPSNDTVIVDPISIKVYMR